MDSVVEAFNHYAEDYDKWFDTPEGKVLFKTEVEAVRVLMRDIEKPFLEKWIDKKCRICVHSGQKDSLVYYIFLKTNR